MKKIYLSLLAVAAMTTVSTAQNLEVKGTKMTATTSRTEGITISATNAEKSAAANTIIQDTLWYHYNKHEFKDANPTQYWVYSSPQPSTLTLSHFGASFENAGTVVIPGIEAMLSRKGTSTSASITVRVLLYNANASGVIQMPAIDSITGVVTGTTNMWVRGNFAIPKVVSGNYAIAYRKVGPLATDTIMGWANNATTTTFGEGLGRIRANGSWAATTGALGGATGDREFIVAPYVTYSITADHNSTTNVTCNTTPVNYGNTSTPLGAHRMYNLNAFMKKWGTTTNPTWATVIADSVYTWNFGDGSSPVYTVSPTKLYLAANTPTTYVSSDALVLKHKSMANYSANGVNSSDIKTWTITVNTCNVGLTENNIANQFAVYPNPASDKVTVMLNNSNSNTMIQVLNALGQVVLTKSNVSEKNELNTESLAKGVYFVKVSNGKESSTSKLIISK
jgi:hypothetical protein